MLAPAVSHVPIEVVGDRTSGGSVSMLLDRDQAVVVLHGAIGPQLHQDVRDLVSDLEAGVVRGLPILVLVSEVTALDLQGVWLLLELRRAARPHGIRLVDPSSAVREALQVHGLMSLLDPT